MFKAYKIITLLSFFINFSLILAQNTLSGTVSDAVTGEKLIGANVYIADQNIGSVTNTEGSYFINNAKEGVFEITVSYIGYLKQIKNVRISGSTKSNFSLEPSSVLLEETVVKGTKAVLRETPVAFTEIKGEDLEMKLASRDIPMELATTPGIYASPQGGGAGDASIYMRGFDQRNIAIMINGVPVNDMETRSVYWSNWAGLGDVTDNIQVQRGLGASPYSVSAVGGLINMTTRGVGSEEEFVKVRSEYGTNSLFKESVAFHKKLSNNFAATAYVASKTWDGYAVNTYAKEYTYFFSIGGVFGNHSLELTGIGSPQEHGTRALSLMGYESDYAKSPYGHTFNKNVGRLNGDWYNDRINKFHKPAFNLNWNWQINKVSTLSTIAYFSFGRGYGTTTSSPYAAYIKTGDYVGFEDYDGVWKTNSTTINKNYSTSLHQTLTPLFEMVNNHNWYGLLSTYTTKLSDNLTFVGGIDGRYYMGIHYEAIHDLIGGDYYLDASDKSTNTRMVGLGDKVGWYNNNFVRQLGGFGQLEYKGGNFTTFINLAASTTGDQRQDFFSYAKDSTTAWVNFFGYTVKTGFNYNLDEHNNIYVNMGYFSNAPLANTIFGNGNKNNSVSKDAVNEKVTAFEIGYGLSTSAIALRVNAFYTNWKDRAMSPIAVTDTDPVSGASFTSYANVTGANQLNTGVEIDMLYKIFKNLYILKNTPINLSIGGNAAIINPKYTSDVDASVAPESDPNRVTNVHVYSNGLYVADFPLNKYVLKLDFSTKLMSDLSMYINPVFTYVSRFYSWFDIDKRTNPLDKEQSWRIPDYNITDLHLGLIYYLTDTWIKKINLTFHVFNLFNNSNYIVNATDGPTANSFGPAHSEINAKVFYGRDRWYNVGVAFTF